MLKNQDLTIKTIPHLWDTLDDLTYSNRNKRHSYYKPIRGPDLRTRTLWEKPMRLTFQGKNKEEPRKEVKTLPDGWEDEGKRLQAHTDS